MIVTFRHADGALGEIAGAVRFDYEKNVHYRTLWMLESEWVRAETDARALATGTGLSVIEMRRVGFHRITLEKTSEATRPQRQRRR